MDFTGTVNAGMAKFAKSMKDGVDNCKVDGKIAEYVVQVWKKRKL